LKITREVKTGILAIGTILLFVFGYSFLKGTSLFEDNRVFYVKYKNVEGLVNGAPVTIAGFNVGRVKSIGFADAGGSLIVKFKLDNDFVFSKESKVQIYSDGLIGGKSLGIIPAYNLENIAKSGDTLSGSINGGMLDNVSKAIGPLQERLTNTLTAIDSLLFSVNDLLDNDTRKDLKQGIRNLNGTMSSLNGASGKLKTLMINNAENIDSTFTNLNKMSLNFSKFSDSLAQIQTGQLALDLQHVIGRFDSIVAGLENGEGTVGKLLKDDQLYKNLEGASQQLESLLQDLRLNPKRYVHLSVFGKKQKEYAAPNDSIK
jgi:phospholipid/cholesterol/gamma-HCH transport system substrate-binding protein